MSDRPPPSAPIDLRGASLRARLLRAMTVVAVTIVLVCALSTFALTRLGGAIGTILRENYASVVACEEMNEALERLDSAAQFSASGHEEIGRPMLIKQRPIFAAAFEVEAHNITVPGERELVEEVERLYRAYVEAVDRTLEGPVEARSDRYFHDLLPRFRALKDDITAIRQLNQRTMEQSDAAARRLSRRTLYAAMAMTAITLAFAVLLMRRIQQTVILPIASFTDRARAIGEGRFDRSIALPEVSELRTLADALNRMQDKLRAYRESSLGELLAAKDLSRATISAMTDPVLVFSSTGEVLLANDAAERIFGVSVGDPDELRSHGVEIPDPIAVARDVVLARGEPLLPQSLSDAMRWMSPDGERYFLVRASPLRRDDEARASVIVVAQDVTRFRRIDVLKSDVVATVSHELKTPLTSLRLATHMLLEDPSGTLDELQRELASTARDETERLQRTVDELLDLVRIEREAGELKRAHVEPIALLREVATAHRALAELRRVTIDVDESTSAARDPIDVDAEQITIVLGNLLSNAIRHSHEGGRTWLSARVEGSEIALVVRDEGEGIDPAHLQRVFERHWSGADPATLKGRHGLGLAIAREIALRHGGRLEVESALGKGSTFTLWVPRARAA